MIDIRDKTTFRVPAMVAEFQPFSTLEELRDLAGRLRAERLRHYILGRGANVLFAGPFDGMILHPTGRGLQLAQEGETVRITADAGWDWDEFVALTTERGLYGIECLSGIPGTVGACPVQNIGAYGSEVAQTLEQVTSYDISRDQVITRGVEDLQLAYRSSLFKREIGPREVILQVSFKLRTTPPPAETYARLEIPGHLPLSPNRIRARVLEIRNQKLPDVAEVGSAGSFFKNPEVPRAQFEELAARFPSMPSYPAPDNRVKLSAGWLIDTCGWRGFRRGDAGVWPHQALVLVNYGHATGAEILALCREIQRDVLERMGVTLLPEVNILGAG